MCCAARIRQGDLVRFRRWVVVWLALFRKRSGDEGARGADDGTGLIDDGGGDLRDKQDGKLNGRRVEKDAETCEA